MINEEWSSDRAARLHRILDAAIGTDDTKTLIQRMECLAHGYTTAIDEGYEFLRSIRASIPEEFADFPVRDAVQKLAAEWVSMKRG